MTSRSKSATRITSRTCSSECGEKSFVGGCTGSSSGIVHCRERPSRIGVRSLVPVNETSTKECTTPAAAGARGASP